MLLLCLYIQYIYGITEKQNHNSQFVGGRENGMDLWEHIKNNTELHTMLMRECDIYTCDSILSDMVGMWVTELSGMTKEEMENNHELL